MARPEREDVRKALDYALQQEVLQGHCHALAHPILQKVSRRFGVSRDEIRGIAEELEEFWLEDRWIAPSVLQQAEQLVAERVSELMHVPSDDRPRVAKIVSDIELDKHQQKAVDLMLRAPIGLVTGPPGSGKTTIVEHALQEFHARGIRYHLAAPTGKAAIRLQETSGRFAQTIHRLLEWSRGYFNRNEEDPLDADVVIIDESSMIDIRLCADLLRAVDPRHTRIIFVGDADQLPPVGPGAPFRDLIESQEIPTAYLRTVHRAAEKSWIYRNSPCVLAGKGVELEDQHDFAFYEMETEDGEYVGEVVLEILNELRASGRDPDSYQVLSPMRKREGGTSLLNVAFQKALNDNPVGIRLRDDLVVTEGDRVIHTRNNYDLNVMNGEVGRVESIDQAQHRITVCYPDPEQESHDRYVRYERWKELNQLELAYALTVHKFQGSQIPVVIFICHSIHKFMLSRQLLYTALTRAREHVYLVGDMAGVKHALKTIRDTQRRTFLRTILHEQLQG